MRNYEMYTEAGDAYVSDNIDMLIKSGLAGGFSRNHLLHELTVTIDSIAKLHPEVRDTEPREHIVDAVNSRLCAPQGWQPISDDDL